ncbi:hypothetical protein MYAM1_000891 [Malassezia yamatoensis]|uniref:RRM domain-containing protein n=1 Tax=Malassezia yamatoensis TaxID=253288 RepID=A0AAJ5YV28_9BASI|nr:hypothetical protein MYAM1_000891 [Malassezia yamatoensis]
MSEPPAYLDPNDPDVHLDQQTNQYVWEGTNGEYEWHGKVPSDEEKQTRGRWVKKIGEEDILKQQEVYSVAGVDEMTPAAPVMRKKQGKKRKEPDSSGAPKPRRNTAVFISQLPLDAEPQEVAQVFSRYGVLLEDSDGKPRVKFYQEKESGAFKGEALVVYFKPESVDLAIQLLDDTYLRASQGVCTGARMRVERAEFQNDAKDDESEKKTRELSEPERKNLKRRIAKMNEKVSAWDEDSDEERPNAYLNARTLILKKMFTLAELDDDATLLLDLKQDVREECESIGAVTNVVLWDLIQREPEGVITVRFRDASAARAAYTKMNGRFFAGRRIVASLSEGRPKFRKSGDTQTSDDEADEHRRADAFGEWVSHQGTEIS